MRKKLAQWSLVWLFLFALCGSALGQQPRLVADNRTGEQATIEVWRYNGNVWIWTKVATVAPGRWVPVYDVRNDDKFRATTKKGTKYHTVSLYSDVKYGGSQDIWLIR